LIVRRFLQRLLVELEAVLAVDERDVVHLKIGQSFSPRPTAKRSTFVQLGFSLSN
jgi:hypothetical protein